MDSVAAVACTARPFSSRQQTAPLQRVAYTASAAALKKSSLVVAVVASSALAALLRGHRIALL